MPLAVLQPCMTLHVCLQPRQRGVGSGTSLGVAIQAVSRAPTAKSCLFPCLCLAQSIAEPQARAAYLWVLGEYGAQIQARFWWCIRV